jgi:hypothetical protein
MRARLALIVMSGAVGLGCPRGGERGPTAITAADGLSVAIYTGWEDDPDAAKAAAAATPQPYYDGYYQPTPPQPAPTPKRRRSVAVVDDRRTVEVDADGAIRLPDVAEGIELASLIVEPLDGRRFAVESCARELGKGGALPVRQATIVTDEGAEISGLLRTRTADGRGWILEDEAGHTHFVLGTPEKVILPGATALEVRCEVDAAPGAHRVRLAYTTRDLSWRASYRADVTAEPEGAAVARIQPTYTIAGTGVIGSRHASVSLLVGLPGDEIAPRLAWRGEVDLGSDAVSVQPEAREIAAHVDHIYRGAVTSDADITQVRTSWWRQYYHTDVWVALAIAPDDADQHSDLPGGPVLIEVTQGETTRQADGTWPEPEDGKGIDISMWPASEVFGFRERRVVMDTGGQQGGQLVEQYLFSVSNMSDQPITVWVEEELRAGAANREIRKNWPSKGKRRGVVLRFRVTIKPQNIERLGFEAEYRW